MAVIFNCGHNYFVMPQGLESDARYPLQFYATDDGPRRCEVAFIRWGQTANYGYVPNDAMPGTFMAVATDLGDEAGKEIKEAAGHSRSYFTIIICNIVFLMNGSLK